MYVIYSIFSPLFGFFSLIFFGRYLARQGAAVVSIFFVFLSFVFSSYLFLSCIVYSKIFYLDLFSWIKIGLFNIHFNFLIDSLSSTMLFVVTLVSFVVHLYSVEYMRQDPHFIRFMAYLSLFTFFMLLLVSSANFVLLFFGWEGVGICSYLLINFWFTRLEANRSAIKAVVMNRIGDCGLLIAIFLIFKVFSTLDFVPVFSSMVNLDSDTRLTLFGEYSVNFYFFLSLSLLLAVAGKSAQLGLHTWLPDAMEGPTPVSALIHAATMVTAGVYLLIRCSPIFENSSSALFIVSVLGGLTMLFGSFCAICQTDIKKLIAFSTASQLGYMVFCCGLSQYNLAIFHLFNHAFFKALLFLSAGSVIHSLSGEQDMRRMGGLAFFLPGTHAYFLVASLSLIAFPFFSGYYSKEAIIEASFFSVHPWGVVFYWLGLFGSFLTTFYSVKLLYMVFWREPQGYRRVYEHIHESSFMLFSIFPLAFLSIFSGFLFSILFSGSGSFFWYGSSIYESAHMATTIESHFFMDRESFYMFLPLLSIFSGFLFCLSFMRFSILNRIFFFDSFKKSGLIGTYFRLRLAAENFFLACVNFFSKKFFFDNIYNHMVNNLFFFIPQSFKLVFENHYYRGSSIRFFVVNLTTKFFSKFHTNYINMQLFVAIVTFCTLCIIYYGYIVHLGPDLALVFVLAVFFAVTAFIWYAHSEPKR